MRVDGTVPAAATIAALPPRLRFGRDIARLLDHLDRIVALDPPLRLVMVLLAHDHGGLAHRLAHRLAHHDGRRLPLARHLARRPALLHHDPLRPRAPTDLPHFGLVCPAHAAGVARGPAPRAAAAASLLNVHALALDRRPLVLGEEEEEPDDEDEADDGAEDDADNGAGSGPAVEAVVDGRDGDFGLLPRL